MATAYTTEALVTKKIGAARLLALLDRDKDGDADDDVLDDAIDEAGAIIDSRLCQRLATPFAAIDDATPTPDVIQVIARHLVLAYLYEYVDAESADATTHFGKADTLLNEILAGNLDVPGASRQTAAKSRVVVSYTSSTPMFGGVDCYGNLRTRGI